LCTGKVYYDLLQTRRDKKIDDVAIIRIEQLYPWPKDTLVKELGRYPNAEVVWCQEESANQGYWTFVNQRFEFILEELGRKEFRPGYAGRPSSASPATGLAKNHAREQALLVEQALNWKKPDLPVPFKRVTALGRGKQ
jgi:2-oxoglutarate dehydrogenase E1 component